MDAESAPADLTELSSQVDAAVVLVEDGSVRAPGAERLLAPARGEL